VAIGWLWRYRAAAVRDPGPERISTFMHTVVIWTLIAALVATLITFAPALLLTTCV
jgi:heme/copper-type cytochrome/quinol oxidase subunit 2